MNGVPGGDESTVSTAEVAITIRDVNDEAPTFKQREYSVTIPENVPFGTPLANLNMEVRTEPFTFEFGTILNKYGTHNSIVTP